MSIDTSTVRPRVSVVMIFLDAELFIVEAIESVLTQTYTQWELLLVDDGSTDGSTAIAQRYAAAHPDRICYLEHKGHVNRGTGASRNLGIHAARGEYVAFLDADDVYLPQRLERHMALLSADTSIGLAISNSLYWHSWQNSQQLALTLRDEVFESCATPGIPLVPPELLVICFTVPDAPMPCTCDITFRREIAQSIPQQFVNQYEDQALICQLMTATRAMVLNECLARYRQHSASLTGRARSASEYRPGRTHTARFQFVQWLRQHLREQHIQSRALEARIEYELWPLSHPHLSKAREILLDLRSGARQVVFAAALRVLPHPLLEKAFARWNVFKRSRMRRRAAELSATTRCRS